MIDYANDFIRHAYNTRVLKSNSQQELVTFIITFLSNVQYIKNPYLKAKLVEVFVWFILSAPHFEADAYHLPDFVLFYLPSC